MDLGKSLPAAGEKGVWVQDLHSDTFFNILMKSNAFLGIF